MQDYYDRVEKITEFIKSKIGLSPKTAVVLGSGLGGFASKSRSKRLYPLPKFPTFPFPPLRGTREG